MRAYCRDRGIDFKELPPEERKREVAVLGRHLIETVGRIVPVVPVPLISAVFLRDEARRLSELEIKAAVEQLIEKLEASGAHVYIPRKDLDYAIHVGLRMLTLRRLVENRDGLYSARSGETALLRYYANSIAHLVRG
jgi:glycerol-3-phosphate O-acyltransferase